MGRYDVNAIDQCIKYQLVNVHIIYCPVRNKISVPSETFRTGHVLTSIISKVRFFKIILFALYEVAMYLEGK